MQEPFELISLKNYSLMLSSKVKKMINDIEIRKMYSLLLIFGIRLGVIFRSFQDFHFIHSNKIIIALAPPTYFAGIHKYACLFLYFLEI